MLAGSQLLIVLDATIVNVALPDIRDDLALGPADLHWVITAYVLAFGGFLLLGGRLADRLGRRRLFVAGATAFGVGSLLAASAASGVVLIAGRALQGVGAAALAPSSLALLMAVFASGRDRDRALAVWGGVSASGAALGLILGGLLTEYLSWPWVFWVTVPVAAVAAATGALVLPESRSGRGEQFDVAGALLVTAGLGAFVLGSVGVAQDGWTALPVVLVAACLLLAFARLQAVRSYALVPVRLIRNRAVLGGNLVGLTLGAAIWALFYFMSLFTGGTLGYGAVATGLAFLPLTVATVVASTITGAVMRRTGPCPLLILSTALVALALAGLIRIAPDSTYPGTVLPAFVLAGLGLGIAFVALATVAVGSAPDQDSGVAAALFTSAQQVGGAIGLAVLTAVSTARTAALTAPGTAATPEAVTQGWSAGFLTAAGITAAGVVVVLTIIPARSAVRDPGDGQDQGGGADAGHVDAAAAAEHGAAGAVDGLVEPGLNQPA